MGRVSALCLWLWLSLGCSTYTPLELPSDVTNTTVGELREDAAWDGRAVRLPNVVILAHDTFDEVGTGRTGTVYFADPGNEPGHGIQAFGADLLLGPGQRLSPGNLTVIEGTFVEFTGPSCGSPSGYCFEGRTLPQMTFGASISRVGFWKAPEPLELTVAQYQADPALYFGSLITLRELEASGEYSLSRGGDRIVPFDTTDGVEVSAELYRIPGVVAGTRIPRLTGVASYFFSDFVLPRGPEDVEVDPTSPGSEEEPKTCSDGRDNDGDGILDCQEPSCMALSVCSGA